MMLQQQQQQRRQRQGRGGGGGVSVVHATLALCLMVSFYGSSSTTSAFLAESPARRSSSSSSTSSNPLKIQSPFGTRTVVFPSRTIALASSSTETDRSNSSNRGPSGGNNTGGNRRPNSNTRNQSNPRRYGSSAPGGGGSLRPGGTGGGLRPGGTGGSLRPGNPAGGDSLRPGGPPVLQLQNPLQLRRLVGQISLTDLPEEERQPRRPQRDNNQRGGGGGGRGPDAGGRGGGRPQRPSSGGPSRTGAYADKGGNTATKDKPSEFDGGDGGGGGPDTGRDAARKRGPPGRNVRVRGTDRNEDQKPQRRQSLRVGTGKKGRGAEMRQRRGSLRKRDRSAEKEARAEAAKERNTVALPDTPLSVSELADIIDEKPVAVIKFLMTDLGVMASMTQSLDPATCMAVAEGFGKIVGGAEDMDENLLEVMAEESALATGIVEDDEDPEDLQPRAPVVTIMGHVDHGKTSLLDAIRNTHVTTGEAGGITQHIAAYQVEHQGDAITFIDTPGHAAFTDMRERGANITDIVILVVAADDGVKQQTADSIVCARQAGVPVVIAINKCDLETADPTKVMTELTAYDLLTEDFGGDVLSSQISAKEGTNLDDLLNKVMMQAELQDLKANPNREAEGIVIEASVEKGLGTVATTLIKKGTLRVGDIFAAGETYGRVRALISTADPKIRLKEAKPSVPVRVVGFEGVPSAGDIFAVAPDEQTARELAESRQRIARERDSTSYQAGLMSSVTRSFGSSKQSREMCVLVKADVQGSAEALTRSLRELKLENDEAVVTVKVLVSEAGEVSKSDIAIASVTPGTTVLAFNVPASFAAMEDARANGVNIEYFNIVYDAIESVESRMQEVLSPTPEGEYAGAATVQEVFNIGGTGNIAGSRCTDGMLKKGANVRVMRGDKILIESRVRTLRSFKAEVDTILEGNECGIGLVDFEAFEPGDVVECYVV